MVLTVSEKKWLSSKLDEHKIPKCCTFSTICVDGYYTVVTEDEENDGNDYAGMLDKRVQHVVEFDGCNWHACEVCGAGPKEGKYGVRRGSHVVIPREKQQMIYRLCYEILEKRGYVIHRI